MSCFPGATTPWATVGAICPITLDQSGTEDAANSRAGSIASQIVSLRQEANALADDAMDIIETCMAFTVNGQTVTYVPPTYTKAQFRNVEAGEPTWSLPAVSGEVSPLGALAHGEVSGTPGELAVPRGATVPPAPPEPPPPPLGPPPTPPGPDPITIPDAPSVAVEFTLPELPTAPPHVHVAAVETTVALPVALDALRLAPEQITTALDALRSIAAQAPPTAPPEHRFVELERAIRTLLERTLPFAAELVQAERAREQAIDAQLVQQLGTFWSDLGHSAPSDTARAEYVQRELVRQQQRRAERAPLIDEQRALGALQMVFQLGASIYGQLLDQAATWAKLEYAALQQQAEVQRELIQAASAAYNGLVAELEAALGGQAAGYARAEARAQHYEALMEGHALTGQRNLLLSEVVALDEEAKRLPVSLHRAAANAQRAQVSLTEAQARAALLQAEAAKLQVQQYQARVATWSTEVSRAGQDIERYTAELAWQRAHNQAAAARYTLQGLTFEHLAQQAALVGLEVATSGLRLREDMAGRAAEYAGLNFRNTLTGATAQAQAASYRAQAGVASARLASATDELESIADENRNAASFFTTAMEAASRAATLTQTANLNLVEAFAAAQTGAGRAAAAVAAGRLSGWNASATLSAGGTLNASQDINWGERRQFSTVVVETDSQSAQTGGGS